MRFSYFSLFLGFTLSACGATGGDTVAGSNDALAQEACAEAEHDGETVHSVLDSAEAVEHALVHSGEPVTIDLAGPTSYVAIEVPAHHSDYGVFTRPAGVLKGTSTSTPSEEAVNGACVDEQMGDNRVHIHEFDHSVLTLEGTGTVWLYFAQHGGSGHDDHDGGTEHHDDGGAEPHDDGGTEHHDE